MRPRTSWEAPSLTTFSFLVFAIVVALVFDFLNGFHDAANAIATVVSTRVLTPTRAAAWAALFNFIAAFVFGTAAAKTICTALIDIKDVDNHVILTAPAVGLELVIFSLFGGKPSISSPS